jgi:hypothetical protein
VRDLYGPLLAQALFPAFEAARGRPTVPLLRYLQATERWSRAALRDLQRGYLRRLVRHAYHHTRHYRTVMDGLGMDPEDVTSIDALHALPLLDRDMVRTSFETRTATAPPRWVIQKSTSGTTGQPVVVKYNAESRHWRDATRWRGYGWSGYRIGMRALHDWGVGPPPTSWVPRRKIALDRALKRDITEIAPADALAMCRRLRGVEFQWRDTTTGSDADDADADAPRHMGLIAQEVEAVYPTLVARAPSGTLGVDYAKLVAVLIQSVKRLDDECAALRARLDVADGTHGL